MNFLFNYKGLWIAITITMNAALLRYDVLYKDGKLQRVRRDKFTYGQLTDNGPRDVQEQVDTLHRIVIKMYTGANDTIKVVDDSFLRSEVDSAVGRFTRQTQDQINQAEGVSAQQGAALLQTLAGILNDQKAQRPD